MIEAPEREVQAGYLTAGWRVWWQSRWHNITKTQMVPASRLDPSVRIVLVTDEKRKFIVAAGHFVAAERTETE